VKLLCVLGTVPSLVATISGKHLLQDLLVIGADTTNCNLNWLLPDSVEHDLT